MLTEDEFKNWCRSLDLSELARKKIEVIRSSEPSRLVGGGRKNVSGRYPSRKMRKTIQFESHRNELAHIYKLEHDQDVLEYYDQPPPIELNYLSKSGRRNRHLHTPDFFVIRKNTAGWEECKTQEELLKKAQESPNRYQLGEHGKWQCPPGEEYAHPLGLYYCFRSSAEIDWIFQRNFVWLEDYFQAKLPQVDEEVSRAVLSVVEAEPGIVLTDLLNRVEQAKIDDLNILIATDRVYVDLSAVPLRQPEQVQVFLDQEEAFTYAQVTKIAPPTSVSQVCAVKVSAGTSISWDGENWQIVNTGNTLIGLLKDNGEFIQLPNKVFEGLVEKGQITGLLAQTESSLNAEVEEILRKASKRDREEANRRYKTIEPFLNRNSLTKPNSTERRWIASYREAEKIYQRGFIGLLPNHQQKGNYQPKISEEARTLMEAFIEDKYETLKQQSISRIYWSFKEECIQQGIKHPSYELFRKTVHGRPAYQQTLKRQGHRAAYQEEPFYWRLDREETPPHGERPFEICHIDHTEADTELVSSIMATISGNLESLADNGNLGRPWVSFLVDAYSRRILAAYLTFDPPSYRSCMMVLRICVQRFGRLPQIIVVDNGAEFNSSDFETLLAYYRCTKKQRPSAKGRFGSVIERFFGVANQEFWHNLKGNTQIMRNVRQVTKGVNPKNQAVWTLGKVYEYLCEYVYEVYEASPHPALRQSPRDAFNAGLARGGSRDHLLISPDEFRLLSLPSPTDREGKRKVTRQGVKINHLYYWHKSFSGIKVRDTDVEVKYDPFDITVAYAYVNKEWVKCSSGYIEELKGHSVRELMIATTELKKLNQIQNRKFSKITGKKLAQFFASVEKEEIALSPPGREAKKAVLAQRRRDLEVKQVHALIDGDSVEQSPDSSLNHLEESFSNDSENLPLPADYLPVEDDDDDFDDFQPLEEW
ncbi:DDE-type integrase/transposase/recombinase [Coleofasciculus sp. FACHB-129]|uniref:DDE-type integrase/transposase/recombinase n=1 Tax=Cyanophyceae TaxID=3028117 RepID=UPI001681C5FB|nr:DDE-type integrase/transposase/recombinase [Coleofasciculus sp. FACHB-129]MBD1897731.1 DDE-type integrase/transposase/recombinase [Coleofasciculus sp. FACHB-129]